MSDWQLTVAWSLGLGRGHDRAAEGLDTAALGDALGLDGRRGFGRVKHDFAAGIEVLTGAGKGDAGKARAGATAVEHAHGVEVAHMAAKGAADPLDVAVLVHARTLGVEVVHVLGPVLDGRVAQVRTLAYKELDGAGVEVGHVVLGRGATLNEVQVGVILDDDERVLKLAGALGVEAEVALQRKIELGAAGHVDKRAARPYGTVQGRKFMVGGRDERHELLVDERLPLRVVQGLLDAGVNDAHLGRGVLHVVVDQLGVILRADARQIAALGLGDAQALKGVLDVVGHRLPIVLLVGVGLDVGDDVVHVQALDGGPHVGSGKRLKISRDFKRRSSIHCGSSFLALISRTMSGVMPASRRSNPSSP